MLLIPETLQLSPRHYHGVVASFGASLEDETPFRRRRHQPLQREPQDLTRVMLPELVVAQAALVAAVQGLGTWSSSAGKVPSASEVPSR